MQRSRNAPDRAQVVETWRRTQLRLAPWFQRGAAALLRAAAASLRHSSDAPPTHAGARSHHACTLRRAARAFHRQTALRVRCWRAWDDLCFQAVPPATFSMACAAPADKRRGATLGHHRQRRADPHSGRKGLGHAPWQQKHSAVLRDQRLLMRSLRQTTVAQAGLLWGGVARASEGQETTAPRRSGVSCGAANRISREGHLGPGALRAAGTGGLVFPGSLSTPLGTRGQRVGPPSPSGVGERRSQLQALPRG